MSNIHPLRDRIVVRREEERKSAGGIVIPDTATEKPVIGIVIAVGPGKTLDNGLFGAYNFIPSRLRRNQGCRS